MTFSEKLIKLRRREGLSQEQLAIKLDVTRQSVSKWESDIAMPELSKLITISELFGVTIDYLVKDEATEETIRGTADMTYLKKQLDALEGEYQENFGPYFAYTSSKRIFGLPLVCVRFGRSRRPTKHTLAVGIIAIGNFSVGVISIGFISLGLLSLGMIAFGSVALGMVSMGLWAMGISVIGVCARGIAAVNLL